MPFEIVTINPGLVLESPRYPRCDCGFVLGHLQRYFSHLECLPAIDVTVERGNIFVSKNHDYLIAAKALGRTRIRAITTNAAAVIDVVGIENAEEVSLADLQKEERKNAVQVMWHVFFLKNRPSTHTMLRFCGQLVGYIEASVSEMLGETTAIQQVCLDRVRGIIEVEFNTPCANEHWGAGLFDCLRTLHNNIAEIASYQGRALIL